MLHNILNDILKNAHYRCTKRKCPRLDYRMYVNSHNHNIQVYSVTVMTHVKALQAGLSSQGTSQPITPAHKLMRSSTSLRTEFL